MADREITYSHARSHLAELLTRVSEGKEIITITSRNRGDVALISADELSSLLESVYLLRSPANAKRLFSALEWAKSTQSSPQTLAQLREELALSRKSKNTNSGNEESVQPIVIGFAPLFSPEFKVDLRWLYRSEPKKADRIMDLLADILDGDPFTGIGTESLKYVAPNTWSRRIDLEHRLVYQIDGNRIIFLQARYHYEE